jgi:hypothetical protein
MKYLGIQLVFVFTILTSCKRSPSVELNNTRWILGDNYDRCSNHEFDDITPTSNLVISFQLDEDKRLMAIIDGDIEKKGVVSIIDSTINFWDNLIRFSLEQNHLTLFDSTNYLKCCVNSSKLTFVSEMEYLDTNYKSSLEIPTPFGISVKEDLSTTKFSFIEPIIKNDKSKNKTGGFSIAEFSNYDSTYICFFYATKYTSCSSKIPYCIVWNRPSNNRSNYLLIDFTRFIIQQKDSIFSIKLLNYNSKALADQFNPKYKQLASIAEVDSLLGVRYFQNKKR